MSDEPAPPPVAAAVTDATRSGPFKAIPKGGTVEISLCAGCIVALALLVGPSAAQWFWYDEIVTAKSLALDWGQLVDHRYNRAHSPLYFGIAKLWVLLFASDPSDPNELLLRAPSLVAMGLAGGFLGACAWRVWGIGAGILFCVLWVLHPHIASHAIEARPYALMLMFLAIGVWANTCLILLGRDASHGRSGTALWIASIAAPVLAAATIPVGAVAAIVVELAAALAVIRAGDNVPKRDWRRRAVVAWSLIGAVVAIFAPAVLDVSENYWTERVAPLSFDRIVSVLRQVLGGADSASLAVLVFSVLGLALRARSFLTWIAASLAIVFPGLLIGASLISSLFIPRYMLPAVAGLLLLAAGGCTALVRRPLAVGGAAILCLSMLLAFGMPRHLTAELAVRFVESLGIVTLVGASNHNHLRAGLDYYLPRRTGSLTVSAN